jgi:hypothetical protein
MGISGAAFPHLFLIEERCLGSSNRNISWPHFFLLFAVLLQAAFLIRNLGDWAPQLDSLRGQSALERSEKLAWGPQFAEYLVFLREKTAPDARLIIPPPNSEPPTNHVGFMQYFLMPREIHNCGPDEIPACLERTQGKDIFILKVKDFPPKEIAERTKRLVELNEDYGLYVPTDQE